MHHTEILAEYWPLLLPVLLIELGLAVAALISIFRHRHYRIGNRWLWVALSLLVQPFGAIAYFLLGREAE